MFDQFIDFDLCPCLFVKVSGQDACLTAPERNHADQGAITVEDVFSAQRRNRFLEFIQKFTPEMISRPQCGLIDFVAML